MSGSRTRQGPEDDGALARARRFLGRVIDTVRGGERPSEVPPPPIAVAMSSVAMPTDAAPVVEPDPPRAEHGDADERVVEVPSSTSLPDPTDPARALLADASWSGLRFEDRGGHALLAWRDAGAEASTLRTVEVHCTFGALDAEPRIVVRDVPASAALGATTLTTDAARVVVALGTLRNGEFLSQVHATIR